MLAFLLHAASSSKLPTDNLIKGGQNSDQDKAVYFDILVRLIFLSLHYSLFLLFI